MVSVFLCPKQALEYDRRFTVAFNMLKSNDSQEDSVLLPYKTWTIGTSTTFFQSYESSLSCTNDKIVCKNKVISTFFAIRRQIRDILVEQSVSFA